MWNRAQRTWKAHTQVPKNGQFGCLCFGFKR
jgi:hypothetical protein